MGLNIDVRAVLASTLFVLLAACTHSVTGSGLLLNVQPAPPGFSSSYDFDLLAPIVGNACVKREDDEKDYWVAIPGLDRAAHDGPTNRAIAAAAYQAVDSLREADTILVMRVVNEGTATKACATVYGRGVKIRKAGAAPEHDAKEAAPSTDVDETGLDEEGVAATVKKIKSEIDACADQEHGRVRIRVVVEASGEVSSATVKSGPLQLGTCVAHVLKDAVFRPSTNGGTFSYHANL